MISSHRLSRFGLNCEYVLSQAPAGLRLVLAYALQWLRTGGEVSREAVARLTEKALLPSPLLPEERQYFWRVIAKRQLSLLALPLSFFRLPDSQERKWLRARAIDHLHAARKKLVKEHLPAAERILDLGGAVDKHPEGALLAMGYPHRPKEIVIVDLPDDQRLHKRTEAGLRDLSTPEGTRVRYVYSSMIDLEKFEAGSFGLVWSGQSIEHITEPEADQLIEQVHRVLAPGGFFCLDTPNGVLTRMISKRYLHPEHKIEYAPEQLAEKIRRRGFAVEAMKAVTPLPISFRLGRVSKLEIIQETRVGDAAETGFSFFLGCRKLL